MIGMSFKIIPYTNHIITDSVAKAKVSSEMSAADFVFHVLITCGRNVMAEMLPAAMPKSCKEVMRFLVEGVKVRRKGEWMNGQ